LVERANPELTQPSFRRGNRTLKELNWSSSVLNPRQKLLERSSPAAIDAIQQRATRQLRYGEEKRAKRKRAALSRKPAE
jgi:hypothetical protein